MDNRMDLCDINVVKAILARSGFRFSKSKGQNFLIDSSIPRAIAEAADLDRGCGVLEIGPGVGCLTQQLCLRAGKVLSVEVDETLRPVLAETMAPEDNFKLRFGDIMKEDISALVSSELEGLRPIACANLPYNITSPVLTALLQARCFEAITVMVQKEVAERICAAAGEKEYSAFSVLCRYYAEPEMRFTVPSSCFIPQPKVTSAVITLRCRKEPPCEIKDEQLFFRVVRAGFGQRRKTLLNSLSSGFSGMGKDVLADCIRRAGLSPEIRAEKLDLPEFEAVAREIAAAQA